MSTDEFARIDRLIQVGLRLARSATSGRVLLARLAAGIDPALVPRPWGDEIVNELEAARTAACEPIAMRRIERVLRDAWEAPPSEALDALETEPVAVTPTSQVHRGVRDGEPVAVKVLRPGLAATVRQDLALLDGLMRPLGAAFPALDAGAVLQEFRERALEELDLENEAQVQRRFHRRLRNHPLFVVPAPITALCRPEVLVSEWVDGVPMRDAPDPDAVAARLVLFVIGSARNGTVYADTDPDDVLVCEDGRLAILDCGLTREVDPDRLAAAAAGLEAFIDDDADAFGVALERLGSLPASHAGLALELGRDALGEGFGTEAVRLDTDALIAAGRRLFRRPDELASLVVAGTLPPPDVWPALAVGQLFSAIARVGATGPWLDLARAALAHGWDADAGSP